MSVCWKCPNCSEETCHTEYIDPRERVLCARCETAFERDQVLCIVCESPNALMRKDSVHYWCLECGHTQTLWSMSA